MRRENVVDLTHETPTEAANIQIKTIHEGWTSNLGRAVLFLGDARDHAPNLQIDVNGIADLLASKMPNDPVDSFAVVVHPPGDNRGSRMAGMDAQGWYEPSEVRLASGKDRESVTFKRALHLVAGAKDINQVLLHEAGHLYRRATGQAGQTLYTPRNARRMTIGGITTMASCMALEVVSAVDMVDGNPARGVALGLLGAAGVFGGGIIASNPKQILWHLSSEERGAQKFAAAHTDLSLVRFADKPMPPDHFRVDPKDLAYQLRLFIR